MSRDDAPRRWWSGQWLMVLLGIVAASILFRFASDRGWWSNNWVGNWMNELGLLSANSQPYQTVNTGASIEVPVSATATNPATAISPNAPQSAPVSPMPPNDRYNSPGQKAMW
jgi:hypothetical protein